MAAQSFWTDDEHRKYADVTALLSQLDDYPSDKASYQLRRAEPPKKNAKKNS
jgi:hypothetical protein